ncbi:MAG: glycoside hydrolase N-terminal domain-containing protein [Bacteroides sp.]|nr:glycoside hydrolase N-terminal domain-containing protein [Bacteroides sp.]
MNTLNNIIKFTSPGDFAKWEQECQPIGNAYMGASFFGGIQKEKIVLNEKTLWTGGPSENRPDYNGGNKPDSYPYVKEVQKLLYEGRYNEALELLPNLTGGDSGSGAYQLLCDLYLEQDIDESKAKNYIRRLDMDKALFSVEFTADGVKYAREAFANYPSNVICLKLSADREGALGFKLYLDEIQRGGRVEAENGALKYGGEIPDNKMRYYAEFRVETDGEIKTCGGSLEVSGAAEAVIYITASTDYSPKFADKYRNGIDPAEPVKKRLDKAASMGYDKLYREHEEDYTALFDRCRLCLNGAAGEPLPADELVKGYKNGDVKTRSMLEELYFQFGRYMLISSSRAGTLPANLQGVWNESNCPPWNCDYHINVNLQMNYWGAYNTNLAETAIPLVDFLDGLRPAGRVTAKEYFGIVSDDSAPENGWTAHTAVNPFGWTAPGWDFYWGWSTAAVAWLMQNIWEHYEFTGDREYLEKRIYPIMRESVRFYSQWLIFDDKQNRLVSSPTYSPEHGPVTVGNTYEQSLIEQLYKDFIQAAELLNRDEELTERIKKDVTELKPFGVNKRGLLKEWYEEDEEDFDFSKTEKNHRHISHLMGLYPGKAITSSTPELMKAAINTMNDRGDRSTGWARAYKLNLWARTGDGERAYKLMSGLLSDCTFVNLFDFHPPFQLDGNFGGSAGIAEMLLQSHEGYINPLAAIPRRWSEGEFEGLCARNGFVLNGKWKNNGLVFLDVRSNNGGRLKIKCSPEKITLNGEAVEFTAENGIVGLDTVKGGEYRLEFV